MTALIPMIVEPVDNVLRSGVENAGLFSRRQAASVLFFDSGGVARTLTINPVTPAIPWTSGFAANANAPVAAVPPATVDLTVAGGPYVTFLVYLNGSGSFVAGQMYIARLADWPSIASLTARTVVILDVCYLHIVRYGGRDLLTNLQVIQAGYQTGASAVSLGGNDTGFVDVVFPNDFTTVPVVTASSYDLERPVAPSLVTVHGFRLTASQRVLKKEPLGAAQYSITIPAGAAFANSANIPYDSGVTYGAVTEITCTCRNPNFIAIATSIQATYFVISVYSVPLNSRSTGGPSTPNTLDPVAGANTGNGSISNTGGENQTHTHATGSGPGVQTGAESVGHLHDVTHNHPIGLHQHPMNAHTHGFTTYQVVGVNTAVLVDYTVFGIRGFGSVTVDASWIAVGS